MSNRLVLFASASDFEKYFEMQINDESIITADYNIAPAREIIALPEHGEDRKLARIHWGLPEENGEGARSAIDITEAYEGLKSGIFKRCIIPVSGYYKWKNNGKRAEFPFFIRMLDEPIMALAGVMHAEHKTSDGRFRSCAIIQTDSNALIQPLDPKMPLQLGKELSKEWLDSNRDFREVIEEARKLFLMTDMTVLRVSSSVNDLSVNSPDLIQPLPK